MCRYCPSRSAQEQHDKVDDQKLTITSSASPYAPAPNSTFVSSSACGIHLKHIWTDGSADEFGASKFEQLSINGAISFPSMDSACMHLQKRSAAACIHEDDFALVVLTPMKSNESCLLELRALPSRSVLPAGALGLLPCGLAPLKKSESPELPADCICAPTHHWHQPQCICTSFATALPVGRTSV